MKKVVEKEPQIYYYYSATLVLFLKIINPTFNPSDKRRISNASLNEGFDQNGVLIPKRRTTRYKMGGIPGVGAC
jgi:hypothetical protein